MANGLLGGVSSRALEAGENELRSVDFCDKLVTGKSSEYTEQKGD